MSFLVAAMAAWDRKQVEYLDALEKAGQAKPTKESLDGYRNIFIEGYLECLKDGHTESNG